MLYNLTPRPACYPFEIIYFIYSDSSTATKCGVKLNLLFTVQGGSESLLDTHVSFIVTNLRDSVYIQIFTHEGGTSRRRVSSYKREYLNIHEYSRVFEQ